MVPTPGTDAALGWFTPPPLRPIDAVGATIPSRQDHYRHRRFAQQRSHRHRPVRRVHERRALPRLTTDTLVPVLKPDDTVILDNLNIHEVVGVREASEAAGARIRALPACNPDLDPIEPTFAELKALRRSAAARTVPDRQADIGKAFGRFTPQEYRNSIAAAWHECDLAVAAWAGTALAAGRGDFEPTDRGRPVHGARPGTHVARPARSLRSRFRLRWARFASGSVRMGLDVPRAHPHARKNFSRVVLNENISPLSLFEVLLSGWIVEGVGGHEAGGAGKTPCCDIGPTGALAVQAAPMAHPAEAALDHPAALPHDEALLVRLLLDDAMAHGVPVAPLLAPPLLAPLLAPS